MADYNIALGVKQPEPVNYLGQMAQAMAIRAAQDEMEGNDSVRSAIRRGVSPTDPSLLGMGKTGERVYKAGLAGEKETLDTAGTRRTLIGQIFKGVADGDGSYDSVARAAAQMVQERVLTPDRAQYYLDQARNATPDQIRAFALSEYKSALSPKDLLPHMMQQDLGGSQAVIAVDPVTGAVRTASDTRKTISPDAAARVAQERENSIRTDKREREQMVFVPNTTDPMIMNRFSGQARPVVTTNPEYSPATPQPPANALLQGAQPGANALAAPGSKAPTTANAAAQPSMIPLKGKPPTPMFENSYNSAVGKSTADADQAMIDAARVAPTNIAKLNEVQNYIDKADVTTGFGADIIKNIKRVQDQFSSSGKSASDTEILDAMLGSGVFPMIQSLGIGARGMDTPAEREFLRGVMTGTISMNKETLTKLTEIRRDIEMRAIEKYNGAVDRGDLNQYSNVTGRKQSKMGMPEWKRGGGAAPSGASGAPTKISGDADYDKLPSGAVFIGPDGVQRRKP